MKPLPDRFPGFGLPWPAAAALWLMISGVSAYIVAFPVSMIAEDTYFYFQLAANVVAGQGVTFHGYTPTNGFHPLWFLVVTGLQSLARDRVLLPHLAMAMVALLAIASFWLAPAAARRLGLRHSHLGLALLVPYTLFTQIGSESALVVPLVALATWAFAGFDEKGEDGDFALLHLALALSVLARLDTVFVAALLGLSSLHVALRRRGFAATIRLSLVPAVAYVLLLGGYLLWNWSTTGHLVPISGALKGAGDAAHGFARAKIADMGWFALALVLASAGFVVASGTRRQRLILLPLYAGIALHAIYIAYFTSGLTNWTWYYGAWMTAGALALPQLATMAMRRLPAVFGTSAWAAWGERIAAAGLAAVTVLLPLAWLAVKMPPVVAGRDAGWARAYVRDFEDHLPKNQGVFVSDYPGALAYLGGYRVLPADGLINDYGYQAALARDGIRAYLQALGIHYVMAPGPDLDAAARARYCGVLVHNATRLSCQPKPDGGAESTGLTVYAALNGQESGVIPLRRDHLAFTVPSLGFGVWYIDPPPNP